LQALPHRHITGPIVRTLLQQAGRQLLGPARNGGMSGYGKTIGGERHRLWQDPVKVGMLLDWLADGLWRLGGRALREPFQQAVLAACPEAAALWDLGP